MTTHYATLEIAETASIEEIRQAHRKLVRANNPTSLAGRARRRAEDRLRAINAAFNVLENPEKHREYDASLPHAAKAHASRSEAVPPKLRSSPKSPTPYADDPEATLPGWFIKLEVFIDLMMTVAFIACFPGLILTFVFDFPHLLGVSVFVWLGGEFILSGIIMNFLESFLVRFYGKKARPLSERRRMRMW